MPKIFLIRNRLHEQQSRLLEPQNLLHAKDVDRLGTLHSPNSNSNDEPLSLVSRKRDNKETTGKLKHFKCIFIRCKYNVGKIFY